MLEIQVRADQNVLGYKLFILDPVKRIISIAAANTNRIKRCPVIRLMQESWNQQSNLVVLSNSISNQVRLPAELKHINKRRKRN